MNKPDYTDRKAVLKHLRYHTFTRRTICEVHREIYDLINEINDEPLKRKIVSKLIDAYVMGMKMNDKLVKNSTKKKGATKLEPNDDWYKDATKRRQRKNEDTNSVGPADAVA